MVALLLIPLLFLLSAVEGVGGGGDGEPRGVSQGDADVSRCQLAASEAVSGEEKIFSLFCVKMRLNEVQRTFSHYFVSK